MSLPGFSAEYGLYKSTAHYGTFDSTEGTRGFGLLNVPISARSRVVPAGCTTGCAELGGLCLCPNPIQQPHCVAIDGIWHCGVRCPPGTIGHWPYCISFSPCPSGQANCDGSCTNLQTDENNCGSCGNTCQPGLTCCNGNCSPCANGATQPCTTSSGYSYGGTQTCSNCQWGPCACGEYNCTSDQTCFGTQCLGPGELVCAANCQPGPPCTQTNMEVGMRCPESCSASGCINYACTDPSYC